MDLSESQLQKEVIKRFGENWVNAKISHHADGDKSCNTGTYAKSINPGTQRVWNKNGLLYERGNWATPLESNIHTDIQSLKDKYPQFNITVSLEERKDG